MPTRSVQLALSRAARLILVAAMLLAAAPMAAAVSLDAPAQAPDAPNFDSGDLPNDLSSIDADLTNVYARAFHIIAPSVFLGAQIDGEGVGGFPGLAADGDDTNNLDDEDGVLSNPALGISAANNELTPEHKQTMQWPATFAANGGSHPGPELH